MSFFLSNQVQALRVPFPKLSCLKREESFLELCSMGVRSLSLVFIQKAQQEPDPLYSWDWPMTDGNFRVETLGIATMVGPLYWRFLFFSGKLELEAIVENQIRLKRRGLSKVHEKQPPDIDWWCETKDLYLSSSLSASASWLVQQLMCRLVPFYRCCHLLTLWLKARAFSWVQTILCKPAICIWPMLVGIKAAAVHSKCSLILLQDSCRHHLGQPLSCLPSQSWKQLGLVYLPAYSRGRAISAGGWGNI